MPRFGEPTPRVNYRLNPPVCDLCRHLYCEPRQWFCEDCLEHRQRCQETAARINRGRKRGADDSLSAVECRRVVTPKVV